MLYKGSGGRRGLVRGISMGESGVSGKKNHHPGLPPLCISTSS